MKPSIFNDVIGPIMRGPSSSHCAAALRIGRLCHDLMHGSIERVRLAFDTQGSLATTHRSQGSDMGMFGGFLGWDATDSRLIHYEDHIAANGMDIHIEKVRLDDPHPNTYRIVLENEKYGHSLVAISTGGGMIEVISIDGADVSIYGDRHELIIYCNDPSDTSLHVQHLMNCQPVLMHTELGPALHLGSFSPIEQAAVEEIRSRDGVSKVAQLHPVLPILSKADTVVPYHTASELLAYADIHDLPLWDLALVYESERGGIGKEEVFEKMREIYGVFRAAVQTGIHGTQFEDRILPSQSPGFLKKMDDDALVPSDVLNRMILYVSAIMEVKSSMGLIVAAPTAGAAGALPGAVLGIADALELAEDDVVRALLSAGLIGVFIASQASFAAEVGGCQAECGSGSCMAAAAIVQLKGGTLKQSLAAASLAMQNSLGMICDPIANRVEAPCLGKNIMAASNALSCANLALADYQHLIPLDQVIQTMARVSNQMARELRCTALGGLAITKAAKEIEKNLGEEPLAEASMRFKIC